MFQLILIISYDYLVGQQLSLLRNQLVLHKITVRDTNCSACVRFPAYLKIMELVPVLTS